MRCYYIPAIVTLVALCSCIQSLGQLPPMELAQLPPTYGVYALDKGELTPLFQDSYGKTPEEQKRCQRFSGDVSIVVFQKWLGEPEPDMKSIYLGDWRTMDDKPKPKIDEVIRPVKNHPEMVVVSMPGGFKPGLYSLGIMKTDYRFGVETDDPEAYWQSVFKENPNRWHAHEYLGAFCYQRGDIDGAIGHWSKCAELRPDLAETHNNYGLALTAKGRTDEALEQYKIAAGLAGTFLPVLFNYADGLRIAKHYEEALEQYQRIAQLSPENAVVYLDTGVTYYQLGRYDQAVDSFKKAIQLKPGYADAEKDLKLVEERRDKLTKDHPPSESGSKQP